MIEMVTFEKLHLTTCLGEGYWDGFLGSIILLVFQDYQKVYVRIITFIYDRGPFY